MAKHKFYVVWVGREPGVYDNWDDCQDQIANFPGAKYKSYGNAADAARAFREGDGDGNAADLGSILIAAADHRSATSASGATGMAAIASNPNIDHDAWAVDASCQGNPGIMEYRGVEVATGRVIFRQGPFQQGTNNIGEFLAVVHALAEMYRRQEWHNIYSDSVTAMAWVRNRQVKTQLKPTDANKVLFDMMGRALAWIRTHTWPVKIMKWQTELWGEIPADFGRK